MESDTFNILFGGEAGQGLVTVGQLLAKSLVRSGYSVLVTQSYESRIRGGHNTFAIRVGTAEVSAPQETIDLLVAFDKATAEIRRAGFRFERKHRRTLIHDDKLARGNVLTFRRSSSSGRGG